MSSGRKHFGIVLLLTLTLTQTFVSLNTSYDRLRFPPPHHKKRKHEFKIVKISDRNRQIRSVDGRMILTCLQRRFQPHFVC